MGDLQANSEVVRGEDGTFIDQNCTIKVQGREFTSGGAFILRRKDTGKLAGQVYVSDKNEVSNWDGSIKMKATFGPIWRSNFGDRRRAVYFRYDGHYFYGMWCGMDYNELVSVREVKPWN